MNDLFERQVWAAAVAAWWTLAIAVVFLTTVWFVFLGLMSSPPGWIERLWGGMSRDQIFPVGLWLIGVFKLCLWLWAMIALWLTLWAWQLQKHTGDEVGYRETKLIVDYPGDAQTFPGEKKSAGGR
jgi:hypothetical protein